MSEILIAGGSGLIGSKLVKKLKQKNFKIVLLSTQKSKQQDVETHYWKPENNLFPELDLSRFSVCFNFCGAGIFDERITEKRKSYLRDSRVIPLQFLRKQFEIQSQHLTHFISASAAGFYPNICLNVLNENSTAGDAFISQLVTEWEENILQWKSNSENVAFLRIGIVLASEGGFLKKLTAPMKYYAGAIPGNGKQCISWIHIDDVVAMLMHLMENRLNGVYNAAASNPSDLAFIVKTCSRIMKRPILLPNIPLFALNIVFGKERACLLQCSQHLDNSKITGTGFQFTYSDIEKSLTQLLQNE